MLSKSVGSAVRAAHHAGLVSKFSTSHSHHHIAPTAAEIAAARKEDVHLANQGGSYERPYVSATWLSKNLDQVHLLDVSWRMDRSSPTTKDDFKVTHIPSASFLDIDAVADLTKHKPHAVPPPQVFADAMNELGIAPTDTVVLYDSNNMTPSTRFWWTCDLFGVQHVRILEGGLAAWKAAGLPLAAGRARGHAELADAGFVYPPTPERQAAAAAKAHAGTGKRFDLSGMRPLESSVVDIDWVRQFVAQSAAGESVDLLLDARSVGRFEGTEPEPRAHLPSGHIPGSANLPFTLFIDQDPISGGFFLRPRREIDHILRKHRVHFDGAKADGKIALTCGSGLTACTTLMALHTTGHRNLALYDGSWIDYATHSDADPAGLPIATGPAAEGKKRLH